MREGRRGGAEGYQGSEHALCAAVMEAMCHYVLVYTPGRHTEVSTDANCGLWVTM